jgi:transcriptional regulator GlxA family with amidase domain
MDVLDATGVHAIAARVVDDGDHMSAAGVTSGLGLGLHVVEREFGPRVAHAVETLFQSFSSSGGARSGAMPAASPVAL